MVNQAMNFYTFKNKEMPWGDYGDILYAGFAYEEDGILYLERAGTYTPPVYGADTRLLLTDELKIKLENSNLKGFTFQQATIKKLVNLEWHLWDLTAEKPEIYPCGGEPENYIISCKHDLTLADRVPTIWGLAELDTSTLIGRKQRNVESNNELFIIENSWSEKDIFTSKGAGYLFFSERAKNWFEDNAKEYVRFKHFNSKIGTEEEIAFALDYIKPHEPKVNPYAHLTTKDWKDFDRFQRNAMTFIEKMQSAKTEKSKASNRMKAIEAFLSAENIRLLPRKAKRKLEALQAQQGQ